VISLCHFNILETVVHFCTPLVEERYKTVKDMEEEKKSEKEESKGKEKSENEFLLTEDISSFYSFRLASSCTYPEIRKQIYEPACLPGLFRPPSVC